MEGAGIGPRESRSSTTLLAPPLAIVGLATLTVIPPRKRIGILWDRIGPDPAPWQRPEAARTVD